MPKFHTGQTIEKIGEEDDYKYFVIIQTYNNLTKYSNRYPPRTQFNDSDANSSLYLLVNVSDEINGKSKYFGKPSFITWYPETEMVESAYCVNEERGKPHIKQNLKYIIDELGISDSDMVDLFKKEVLGD